MTHHDRPEIEVTPAMIEAGMLALSEYDLELESLREGATRIFRTMASARLPIVGSRRTIMTPGG